MGGGWHHAQASGFPNDGERDNAAVLTPGSDKSRRVADCPLTGQQDGCSVQSPLS